MSQLMNAHDRRNEPAPNAPPEFQLQNRTRPAPTPIEYITLSSDDEIEVIPPPPKRAKMMEEQKPKDLLENPQLPEVPSSSASFVIPQIVVDNEEVPEDPRMKTPSPIQGASVAMPVRARIQESPKVSRDPTPLSRASSVVIPEVPAVSEPEPLPVEVLAISIPTTSPDTAPSTSSSVETVESVTEVVAISSAEASSDAPARSPLKKKVANSVKPVVLPSRKSTRNKKDMNQIKEDEELVSNFNNGIGVISRGTIVPRGLSRTPFHFKKEATDDKAGKVKDMLKIDMQPVFTPAGHSSKDLIKRKARNSLEPSTSDADISFMKNERGKIRTGEKFQATIPDIEPSSTLTEYMDQEDKEEIFWETLDMDKDNLEESKKFHETLRNVYWRAIWRQFQGHIPFETALQHLMKNNLDFAQSLETIDENLKSLPQSFKEPCVAQVKIFDKLLQDKKTTRRQLQEKAMRNYHIAEVQQYHYRFRKFFKYQEKYGVVCNCAEKLCNNLKFEPRYGCTNCKKNVKSSSDHGATEKLCLICQTYQKLTGNVRPARNVEFCDDELEKIYHWSQKEEDLNRTLSREEFEELVREEKNKKWKNNDLSAEETAMLNQKELRIPNRRHRTHLSDQEKQARGEKICAQLQPYVLPHFSKCNCKRMGRSSWRCETEGKSSFSIQERKDYFREVRDCKGDLQQVARNLKVAPEVVRAFINIYGIEYDLEIYFPNKKLPNLIPIVYDIPPSNLPPIIPDGSSNSSSRDGSPYIPPEERSPKKRRSN
ncbi:ELM2 domain-containing protein [Caenorhabditis elegans]|uniref:ELM2 domain-containing protein n=1 Tax=Caenorhabditis elegans TaxID=6239 RepID=Q9NF71_CAEEL|nr:ELM2 domain-containing protein [Caenorhabditis elegans]CAB54981.1 ELM2 domain-containing protein [Caenorhabditis elegans]|eukprot:NP_502871.1 Uncharacterized protein CELE_Y105C5A.1 [Caenorhabditis elegans]